MKKKTGDIQSAIHAADDVTTNFKRSGNAGRNINAIIMFNNASVQGLDKFIRGFTNGTINERISHALKWIMSAMLTSAFLAWFNRKNDEDKESYENLSAYTKNNFYAFSIGNGKFIKIPKAREVSVLDSFVERAID